MTDTVATTPAPVVASPAAKKSPAKKKLLASKSKKTTVALHPTTAVMVTSAIKELKEKKGSSLPAIKKYLAANYKVDPAKLAPFIRKFLKAAVANGTVVQTKGTGASGHFKLPVAEVKAKKVVNPVNSQPVHTYSADQLCIQLLKQYLQQGNSAHGSNPTVNRQLPVHSNRTSASQ
ncbi:histone H1B-like [Metopolophium dirhodum]|uniref:histone H1B-like n=1 Tax=Metopolophium dirhodum TaxID=44670 RepID=UPI00298FDF41|nr:histone H1B-like [Metopolophium dirhodum]